MRSGEIFAWFGAEVVVGVRGRMTQATVCRLMRMNPTMRALRWSKVDLMVAHDGLDDSVASQVFIRFGVTARDWQCDAAQARTG